MPVITASQLAQVNGFPKLIDLLREQLEWPIGEDYGIEDVTFEYEPHELGLKPEETAKIREIHQLRPLVTGQPWGVFFISFEEKTISVTVLRRMLKALVVKKRAGAQAADRQAWNKEDLIFAANFGKSGERELAFVHFSDSASTGDLPVMKVLGWNARDTKLHNQYVASQLQSRLTWPDDPADEHGWRGQWSSAFEIGLNQVIRTSKELAIRLAGLAGDIRARANQLLEAEDETGPMRTMLEAFRKNLIQDLDEDGFADMFAQTICYGMLAAKISRPGADLIADNLADMVPRTNPFLKELFANFLKLGGRDKRSSLDFDELGVRDVVDMLNRANMERVLEDFGNRNPKKDPVIHFYEDFLKEYDKDQKVDAGIFYTPPAVVGFIVRGVDEMLRTEFDLPLGLADTSTWAELAARNDKITIPEHVDPQAPFVQILDPATGTGTFLVEVIDLIHKHMVEVWKEEGKSALEIKAAWNEYVPQHLLPRLTAFELKMAAYAIAHMKIGIKLLETGYTFGSNERAHILLTNTLQPARGLDLEERMRLEAMAHEAERANEAKEKTPFTVVIGNPPYKGHSMNPSKVKGKLTFAGEIIKRFKQVRGKPLNEKNPKWLNNDYVKFMAFAMRQIEKSGAGVIGYITSNSWLDSPTFRGVRTGVMDSFPLVRVLDLHGNVKKKETAPDGTKDEGVFDIEEGTNITIVGKLIHDSSILQFDLLGKVGDGTDEGKFKWLEFKGLNGLQNTLVPMEPMFFFIPRSSAGQSDYDRFEDLNSIFSSSVLGFQTHRDDFAIDFNSEIIASRITDFLSTEQSDQMFQEKYQELLPKTWDFSNARQNDKNPENVNGRVFPCDYRPFDTRHICIGTKATDRDRSLFVDHVFGHSNILFNYVRQTKRSEWQHIFATNKPTPAVFIEIKDGSTSAPLWLQPSVGEPHRRPNIDRNYAVAFGKSLGLVYEDGIPRGDAQANLGKDILPQKAEQMSLETAIWNGRGDLTKNFGPRDLFDYIYAVLHAPGYRRRYAEFLKSAFPRIPTPDNLTLFKALVPLGCELVALHLVKPDEAKVLKNPEIRLAGTGEARVEKGYPQYKNGKVMINTSRWFEDVPAETWAFHIGGYQVCQKWLKDRAGKGGKNPSEGRILTEEDILHYRRTVTALTETRRIMAEIDQVIEDHGGWPEAFCIASDDCESEQA